MFENKLILQHFLNWDLIKLKYYIKNEKLTLKRLKHVLLKNIKSNQIFIFLLNNDMILFAFINNVFINQYNILINMLKIIKAAWFKYVY